MNFLTEITAPLFSYVELRWFSAPDELLTKGIDMGNGQTLPAEDVLDGHFQRLTKQQVEGTAGEDERATKRVDSTLNSAVQKLSPELAPLTDLATNLAEQTDMAFPAPQFRQNLHNALERAHQEQSARRVLGIQPQPLHDPWPLGAWRGWVLLLLGASTVLGLFITFKLYRRTVSLSVK